MSQQVINIGGNANDGSGDSLRAAFTKANQNFAELYANDAMGYSGSGAGGNGYTGSRGFTGSQGFTGSRGFIGFTGYAGSVGYSGSVGYTGSASTQAGYSGSVGSPGYSGSASTVAGYSGSYGNIGYTGSAAVTDNIIFSTSTISTLGTDEDLTLDPNGAGNVNVTGALITTGYINDSFGNVRDLINNNKTSAYVLIASDNGKMINITTGGVTVDAGIFSVGNNITIYNNSSSDQTITEGSGTIMYLDGVGSTGNRTLPQRGIAKIICVDANTFVISGIGVT